MVQFDSRQLYIQFTIAEDIDEIVVHIWTRIRWDDPSHLICDEQDTISWNFWVEVVQVSVLASVEHKAKIVLFEAVFNSGGLCSSSYITLNLVLIHPGYECQPSPGAVQLAYGVDVLHRAGRSGIAGSLCVPAPVIIHPDDADGISNLHLFHNHPSL